MNLVYSYNDDTRVSKVNGDNLNSLIRNYEISPHLVPSLRLCCVVIANQSLGKTVETNHPAEMSADNVQEAWHMETCKFASTIFLRKHKQKKRERVIE